jgi:hypothetical protein
MITNYVMGGLSDLLLVVDGDGMHGFTAVMGFDAGIDLKPPAPNRTNVFVNSPGNTFTEVMPHHAGSVVEPYMMHAVPIGFRFQDPTLFYQEINATGGSMVNVQTRTLLPGQTPRVALVDTSANSWASALLRTHYSDGVPPVGAETTVTSSLTSGEPLVVELAMPTTENVGLNKLLVTRWPSHWAEGRWGGTQKRRDGCAARVGR